MLSLSHKVTMMLRSLALAILLTVVPATASVQLGLDPTAEPNYGTKFLRAGFTPDPYTVQITSGGPVSIARTLGGECAGYATANPDYKINWSGGGSSLKFYFLAEGDTTLVVHAPNGSWYCNDDFSGTNDPYVNIANPGTGTFSIWVGSYNQDSNPRGALYVTEGSGTPVGSGNGSSQGTGQEGTDSDADGLADSMELWIAETFTPIFEFDEEEHDILSNTRPITEFEDVIFLYQVTPVDCYVGRLFNNDTVAEIHPVTPNSSSYLLTIVPTYEYDYVPYDPVWGPEEDYLAHYGDTERVRLCIDQEGNDYTPVFVLLNRHGHSTEYFSGELEWSGTHVYLYVSEGKHATFASGDECEDSVEGAEWLGWDEDCSGGVVMEPSYTHGTNVGEWIENAVIKSEDLGDPRVAMLFPGEFIWSPYARSAMRDNFFCGGYDITEYNKVRYIIYPFYEWEWCGGGLNGKWIKPPSQ